MIMNDIQKAIDELREWFICCHKNWGKIISSPTEDKELDDDIEQFDKELKSLLEQVAKEAFHAGTEYGANSTCFTTFKEWWKEQNLTFNED